jgi:ankyrin repeat protein
VQKGHEGVLRVLMDAGADPAAREVFDDSTPLHFSRNRGHGYANAMKMARMLLEAGADPNARNRHGKTPLHAVAQRGDGAVLRLLLDAGADAMARMSCNLTPLHHAAAGGDEGIVRMLLDAGADGEAKNDSGDTPEDLAHSHPEVQPSGQIVLLGLLYTFAPGCASQRRVKVHRFDSVLC